jgi:hypothetical protein
MIKHRDIESLEDLEERFSEAIEQAEGKEKESVQGVVWGFFLANCQSLLTQVLKGEQAHKKVHPAKHVKPYKLGGKQALCNRHKRATSHSPDVCGGCGAKKAL